MSLSPTMFVEPNDVRAAAVAVVGTDGVQLPGFDPSRPASSTLTSVTASVTSVTLLASNAARRRVIVFNDGAKTLFVAFAATASATAFTVAIAGQSTYQGVLDDYTGIITGIWTAVSGSARITEITT